MKQILSRANKKLSLGNAAALLVVASLMSQLLGFLRVKLVNANFSAYGPESTDAFFAAFKIPDFFFFTLAAGALGVAFMPVLAEHLHKHDKKGAWELSSSLMNMLAAVMFVVGAVIFVFAEPLIHYIVAPRLEPQQLHNAVTIMRLIAFNPLLFTIAGIFTSMQQTYGRFFFYALAPIVYNGSIIISIFIFRDSIGLIGLGVGALVGALLQLVTALLGLRGLEFTHTWKIDFSMPDLRRVLRQLPPRSIDQGITSINSIIATNYARRLGTGYVSFYENAYVLHTAPTLLIGTAISTAVFPRFNHSVAAGHSNVFRQQFLQILRVIIWITMPVVVISFFSRGYLARLIFSRNAPDIAVIFGFLCGAIFFRTIYTIISRYFYAQHDTWTPLIDSLFAIVLYIGLVSVLAKPSSYGASGIAIAESIVAACQLLILSSIMIYRDPKLLDVKFWGGIVKIISATGISAVVAFIMVTLLPLYATDTGFLTLGFKLGMIAGVTLIVHVFVSSLFDLEEARPITRRVSKAWKLLFKPVRTDW